jgi:hypothetical protein
MSLLWVTYLCAAWFWEKRLVTVMMSIAGVGWVVDISKRYALARIVRSTAGPRLVMAYLAG